MKAQSQLIIDPNYKGRQLIQGYLKKTKKILSIGRMFSEYNERFFTLNFAQMMFYYTENNTYSVKDMKEIPLLKVQKIKKNPSPIFTSPEKWQYSFIVCTQERDYYLHCSTEKQLELWLAAFSAIINKKTKKPLYDDDSIRNSEEYYEKRCSPKSQVSKSQKESNQAPKDQNKQTNDTQLQLQQQNDKLQKQNQQNSVKSENKNHSSEIKATELEKQPKTDKINKTIDNSQVERGNFPLNNSGCSENNLQNQENDKKEKKKQRTAENFHCNQDYLLKSSLQEQQQTFHKQQQQQQQIINQSKKTQFKSQNQDIIFQNTPVNQYEFIPVKQDYSLLTGEIQQKITQKKLLHQNQKTLSFGSNPKFLSKEGQIMDRNTNKQSHLKAGNKLKDEILFLNDEIKQIEISKPQTSRNIFDNQKKFLFNKQFSTKNQQNLSHQEILDRIESQFESNNDLNENYIHQERFSRESLDQSEQKKSLNEQIQLKDEENQKSETHSQSNINVNNHNELDDWGNVKDIANNHEEKNKVQKYNQKYFQGFIEQQKIDNQNNNNNNDYDDWDNDM